MIWPLAVGNSWTYEYEEEDDLVTITIIDKVVIDGNTWYLIYADELALRNDSEGVWGAEYWNGEIDDEGLIVKYPIDVGDTFNENYEDEVLMYYWTCTSKNATFGQYNNCYEYEEIRLDEDDDDYYHYLYFKPDIGYLGNEGIYGGTQQYRMILKSYNIESDGNSGLSPF